MTKEYETKVLDINDSEIEKKLKELGAKKVGEYNYRRLVFDLDSSLSKWVRLRTDGEKTTLTYKEKSGFGISETTELETTVEDFDEAAKILSNFRCDDKFYQESHRIMYELNEIEFCLDTWPQIPTYLEVESTSEEKVEEGLEILGLKGKEIGNVTVVHVYEKYGIDLHKQRELKITK